MIRRALIFSLMLAISTHLYAKESFMDFALQAKKTQITQVKPKTLIKPYSPYANRDILALRKNWIVIFFFSSSCPHCRVFAPVMAKFLKDYGFDYRDYTLDAMPLPSFKDPLPVNRKLIQAFFGQEPVHYPAVFIINKNTLSGIPISVGELTYPELMHRFLQVAHILESKNANV